MPVAQVGTAVKIWHTAKPVRRRVMALREMHNAGEEVGVADMFDDLSELEKNAKKIRKERKKTKKKRKRKRKKYEKEQAKLLEQRKKRRKKRQKQKAKRRKNARRKSNPFISRDFMEESARGVGRARESNRDHSDHAAARNNPKKVQFWQKFVGDILGALGEPSEPTVRRHRRHHRK